MQSLCSLTARGGGVKAIADTDAKNVFITCSLIPQFYITNIYPSFL